MNSTHKYSKLDKFNDNVEDVLFALIEKGPKIAYRFLRQRLNESPEHYALRVQKNSGMEKILQGNTFYVAPTPNADTYLSEIRGRVLFADLCNQNNIPVMQYEGTNNVTHATIYKLRKAMGLKSLPDQLAIDAMAKGGNRMFKF